MTYKTIENALKSSRGQMSLNNIVTGRFNHYSKGYTKLVIKDIDLKGLLSTIGGNKDYSIEMRRYIAAGSSCGIMSRLIYNKDKWNYCAGQDYTAEMNTIRKILREVNK